LALTGVERDVSETPVSGSLSIVETIVPFRRAIVNMGYLPNHIQIAILIFAARIATWARKSYGPKPPSETTEARRNRILQSYGMKSMEELRNRY